MLLAADDTTGLGFHQILLGQATGRVMCSAVENLGLGADSDLGATVHHLEVLTSATILTCVGHFVFCLLPRKVEWRPGYLSWRRSYF